MNRKKSSEPRLRQFRGSSAASLNCLAGGCCSGWCFRPGHCCFLLWLTGEVFEGDTAVFDERLRSYVHGFSNPALTVAMRSLSFLGSTVFLVTLGVFTVVVFAYLDCAESL